MFENKTDLISKSVFYRPLYQRATKRSAIQSIREIENLLSGERSFIFILENGDIVTPDECYLECSG